MNVQHNTLLGPFTSLRCGGPAEVLITTSSTEELLEGLRTAKGGPLSMLGYGTNSLISDYGLAGTTIITHGGDISFQDDLLVADAGAWWGDLVQLSIEKDLWGIELMSGIPSSVGGAVMGNIAAYGQQVSDTLAWIEVFNRDTTRVQKLSADEITFNYRSSSLHKQPNIVILRAAFRLSPQSTTHLAYASAQSAAEKLGLDTESLNNRRLIILEARRQAGSLWDPNDANAQHTAGSFFKNPLVTQAQAEEIAKYDETGKSLERLLAQNRIHGGSISRSSAAHVLLAAGFKRGQTWGAVRLHPDHILKIENIGNAKAQEIYNVAQRIIQRVKEELTIVLEPEVTFIGQFDSVK
ncbi:MAG: FAD-binding protein [Candidatus Saccharimonadales bacterium]